MTPKDLIALINSPAVYETFASLYGAEKSIIDRQKDRYVKAVERFAEIFPERDDVHIFSAPGRSEIGGNHTDHQRGCALAAAVDLDVIAAVAFHDDGVIRFESEGYGMSVVELDDLSVREDEKGTSKGIIRGMAAGFGKMGVRVGGFDAYSTSDVIGGSGLSSSAAFETLIGAIIDVEYNDSKAGAIEIAKLGRFAENAYFGKGSGLLDQTVCSVGGFVFIDFNDLDDPYVKKYSFDFKEAGYDLCITDTKGSHSDLTPDYVAVPSEMKSVAALFGKDVLRDVDEDEFFSRVTDLRGKVSDRAIMRAIHFFGENRRAKLEAEAVGDGRIDEFFGYYRASAASSSELLQNLYSTSKPTEQGIPLGIAVSKLTLGSDAAVRVHGGGFAGTIQAFVPVDKTPVYKAAMDELFGKDSCHILRIRPVGGVKII